MGIQAHDLSEYAPLQVVQGYFTHKQVQMHHSEEKFSCCSSEAHLNCPQWITKTLTDSVHCYSKYESNKQYSKLSIRWRSFYVKATNAYFLCILGHTCQEAHIISHIIG